MGPYATIPYSDFSIPQRIWDRVQRPDGEQGCWLIPTRHPSGYTYARVSGRTVALHRLFYVNLVGPVPSRLTLDHLCRVKHCVNPAHLAPVTQAENNRRGRLHLAPVTHCKNGHPFNEANTYRSRKQRHCRICTNAASSRYKARRKERMAA